MENKDQGRIHLTPQELISNLALYRKDPVFFICDLFSLKIQPAKPEYTKRWEDLRSCGDGEFETLKQEVCAEWFGDYDEEEGVWVWHDFVKGKHITWQQTLILIGLRKASNGGLSRNISIVSGHGIGKSATMSWIILWFLLVFDYSQVAATAPTAYQMHDVLWKECSKWLSKMKYQEIFDMYEWQKGYIRITAKPEEWFARAKTATKENPEALAGVHADHVLLLADEASGIAEQIYNTAEGALTSGNVFMVLISNGTRTLGYFYDTHHKNSMDWQTFSFNGEESPIVDRDYIERIAKRHGKSSDEYTIRARGGFPKTDSIDDSGYFQLTPPSKVRIKVPEVPVEDMYWFGRVILGIDPAGEGKDTASFVLRDRFKAACLLEMNTSNPRTIAERALYFIEKFKINEFDVVIDSFGQGADVAKEIAIAKRFDTYPVLVGNKPIFEEKYNSHLFRRLPDEVDDDTREEREQKDLYLNIRALMHARASKWLIQGGELVDHNEVNSKFKEQVCVIRAKRAMQSNNIQLMPKKEMQKLRIPSPNIADAFALTFLRDLNEDTDIKMNDDQGDNFIDDPYALL